jgi:integrase
MSTHSTTTDKLRLDTTRSETISVDGEDVTYHQVMIPTQPTELGHAQAVGQAANEAAQQNVFIDYLSRKASNTIAAQQTDLKTWLKYGQAVQLYTVAESAHDADLWRNGAGRVFGVTHLQQDPELWIGTTWGLVAGFVQWMLKEGYAIGSINRKLSTLKTYCKLAAKSGVIDTQELTLIRSVSGYGQKDGKRVNERRETSRVGAKKEEHTSINVEVANQLKYQPDTPQGRRDTVIMAILLDHGLRVGELVGLQVTDFNMKDRTFMFYREKVDKEQTHTLTRNAFDAVKRYFDAGDAPAMGPLLRGSRKNGTLTDAGMNRHAISKRVRKLGEDIGIDGLSSHDCRHYWATQAVRSGTDIIALRDAGGWSSLAMPSRYVEAGLIANFGVKLF